CGPCEASMPHLQKTYERYKSQGVDVYASCTADAHGPFEQWVARNRNRYTFPVAFDPAGRGPDRASYRLYGVDGIPTQFVIGTDGKVVAVIVGYDGPTDHRLEHALAEAGVKVGRSSQAPAPVGA
ncbi:MAG: TlpA family protein disulfide reductase, partial [Opitutaceae bacterium]